MQSARLELPATPAAPSVARLFVRCLCEEWGVGVHADVAELLSSELVTNAVVHAQSSIRLDATCGDDGGLRVEVWDWSPGSADHVRPRLAATASAAGRPAVATNGGGRDESTLTRAATRERGDMSVDDEGGRGLTIVARLANAWGVEANGHGKRVWFALDAHA